MFESDFVQAVTDAKDAMMHVTLTSDEKIDDKLLQPINVLLFGPVTRIGAAKSTDLQNVSASVGVVAMYMLCVSMLTCFAVLHQPDESSPTIHEALHGIDSRNRRCQGGIE